MKILIDLHTHTVSSGHAYSTLQENVQEAKNKGLEYYGFSDHGPMMPGAPHIFHFQNIKVVPREINGVKVLRGVEANIIDFKGSIDMTDATLRYIDYVIASAHMPCIISRTIDENTNALIGAMKNPRVQFIGHPDDGRFQVDYKRLVKAAKEENVILEVNNSSLDPKAFRQNGRENVIEMLKLCKELEVQVLVSSDAHISFSVGEFNYALEILTELNFPEHLVINTNPEKFLRFIGFTQ
jgi:putative hydrolase